LKRGEAEREKIIQDQRESIQKQSKMIKFLNARIDNLGKKIDGLDKKRQELENKKKKEHQHYSKPLPRPEEDKFFVDNGFSGYRENNSGRFFTNADVVKVQTLIIDNKNMKKELDLASQKIDAQKSLIQVYKEKCAKQEKTIASWETIDAERQKELKKYKMEAATNKFYKWTAIIAASVLGGYSLVN